MLGRVILFLVINFAALAIGGFFTGAGVSSDWYANLAKAPWTPPGWVFGAAWTTIMVCFSLYMSFLWSNERQRSKILILFVIQWILNVSWNPVFFYLRQVELGMIIITSLTVLIGFLFWTFRKHMSISNLLLAPYFIWLLIATSLNGYILFMN